MITIMAKVPKGIILSLIVIGIGLGILIYSIVTGGSKLYLFLFFPLIVTDDIFGILGALFIIIGFVVLFASFTFYRAKSAIAQILEDENGEYEVHVEKPKITTGGVIFIGPIPIVWGSDKKVSKNMWYVAIIITIILVVLTLLWVLGTFYR